MNKRCIWSIIYRKNINYSMNFKNSFLFIIMIGESTYTKSLALPTRISTSTLSLFESKNF